MTKDTISRAIARGGPRELGSDLSRLTYEVVMPGGIAFIMYISPMTRLTSITVRH